MKVVLDTNIYLSGLIFPKSKPALIILLAKQKQFSIYISQFILDEIRRNLLVKFNCKDANIQFIINDIIQYAKIITPSKRVKLITQKKDDNLILDCAIAAQGDFLITGDKKHILPLKKIGRTKIVSAAEFLKDVHL